MMYAKYIRMKSGCQNSYYLTEIDSIYLEGENRSGLYKKEEIHEFLKVYPGRVKVSLPPYPDVIPAVSVRNERYVKSTPNESGDDNLLRLRRV